MRQLVAAHFSSIRTLLHEADRIVVLCDWSREVLERNSIPPEKLTLVRHGLPVQPGTVEMRSTPIDSRSSPRRLAFLGRLGPAKGPDTLVRAFQHLQAADLTLDIYGIAQDPEAQAYRAWLQELAAGDTRIRFLPPVPQRDVVALLRAYHVLAVPSRWLETGPLVVLEAFAAGTPVIGSNLGGIRDLVRDGIDGLLVPEDRPEAWASRLRRFVDEPDLVARLRSGIGPVRSEDEVARDMVDVYAAVLGAGVREASHHV
jgi:glycosyltransferase involved in cell wall biosynthesis